MKKLLWWVLPLAGLGALYYYKRPTITPITPETVGDENSGSGDNPPISETTNVVPGMINPIFAPKPTGLPDLQPTITMLPEYNNNG